MNKSFMLVRIVCHDLFAFENAARRFSEPKVFNQLTGNIGVNIFAFLFQDAFPARGLHAKASISQNYTFGMLDDLAAVPDGQAPLLQVIINVDVHQYPSI